MSTLRTLHDAFGELERRADGLPLRVEQAEAQVTPPRSGRRRRSTRWVPLAAAAAVAAIVAGGIVAGTAFWPASTPNPAAPAESTPVTLWVADDAPCPAHPAGEPAAGAVLKFHDECVRTVGLAGTIERPLDAHVIQGDNGWGVNVALTDRQAVLFARATTDAVGHRLAIVGDGQVLSAPVVREPATVRTILITAASAVDARTIARILGVPLLSGASSAHLPATSTAQTVRTRAPVTVPPTTPAIDAFVPGNGFETQYSDGHIVVAVQMKNITDMTLTMNGPIQLLGPNQDPLPHSSVKIVTRWNGNTSGRSEPTLSSVSPRQHVEIVIDAGLDCSATSTNETWTAQWPTVVIPFREFSAPWTSTLSELVTSGPSENLQERICGTSDDKSAAAATGTGPTS